MPKQMLYSRCLSMGANRIAPDKVQGLYTTEEVMDFAPDANAKITEEGEVVILENNK
jgi:hypothetical protein